MCSSFFPGIDSSTTLLAFAFPNTRSSSPLPACEIMCVRARAGGHDEEPVVRRRTAEVGEISKRGTQV